MKKNMFKKIKNSTLALCQRLGATRVCPTESSVRVTLLIAGLTILAFGLSADVFAANASQGGPLETTYNDVRIANAVNVILTYLEGSFGALIMATAGIFSIMMAAFGQYKTSLSLMVVAIGTFILRSLMSTFFNDENIMQ
jgi:hypothetical protein